MCREGKEAEPLLAMKALLRDLENAELNYPDDISALSVRRDLTAKIAALEKTHQPIAPPIFLLSSLRCLSA